MIEFIKMFLGYMRYLRRFRNGVEGIDDDRDLENDLA